jgi:transposase
MMGRSQKTEPKLFYHGVSLERRISADHPLRRIDNLIDFSFVRAQVEELYGCNGNVSIDPTVILKLMFLLYYEDVKSERALMEQLPLRLDWLWFCGYDLDEQTPNHSVISKARRRWGKEVFDRFFNTVLTRCIEAGLVAGDTVHIDSSMIEADADREKLQAHVKLVTEQMGQRLDEPAEEETDWRKKHPVLESPTDPDARIGRKNGERVLGYKDHRVIDDKCGIVTATVTTPANINDSLVMREAVEEHTENTGTQPQTVVADKGYGVIDNYKYLNEVGANPCIPHQTHAKEGRFSIKDFCHDRKNDRYICPAGQLLNRVSHRKGDNKSITIYRCAKTSCTNCGLRDRCMTGQTSGRMLQVDTDTAYIAWADNCLSRHERRRLLNRRKQKAEGSFADATNNHGFKQARWRGLMKMGIQNLLIAAVQNIRKLLRHTSRTATNLALGRARNAIEALITLQSVLPTSLI